MSLSRLKPLIVGSLITVFSFVLGLGPFVLSTIQVSPPSTIPISDMQHVTLSDIEKAKLLMIEHERKSEKLLTFLKENKSPIADIYYASLIIRVSEENKADYRLNVAIMLIESGICKQPLKKYNCYGYLNKVQYKGWEDALIDLTGKVSRQYTSPFGHRYELLASKYGMKNTESARNNFVYVVNKLD